MKKVVFSYLLYFFIFVNAYAQEYVIHILEYDSPVISADFISSRYVVSTAKEGEFPWEGYVYIYDMWHDTVRSIRTNESNIGSAIISPDSKYIAVACDKIIKIWDFENLRLIKTLVGHNNRITSLSYSPDGRKIVSGSWLENIKIWDVQTERNLLTIPQGTDLAGSVIYSHDGNKIVSTSGKSIFIWDANTGRKLLTLNGHSSDVYCLTYNREGDKIYSGSGDKTVRIWNASTGQLMKTISLIESVFSITTLRQISESFPEKIVVGLSGGYICIIDSNTGVVNKTIEAHEMGISSLRANYLGSLLASASNDWTIKIWDIQELLENL